MKKVIAIVVSVLFVLSVAGLSFAAEQKTAPAAPAEKKEAAPAPAEKKMEKKTSAKAKTVTGEVAAVDAAAKTLTVKGKKGEVALSVEGKAADKLADIKVGDKVTVKYKEMDGKNVASSVAKKAEKKSGKKKEAAPAPAEKPMEKK